MGDSYQVMAVFYYNTWSVSVKCLYDVLKLLQQQTETKSLNNSAMSGDFVKETHKFRNLILRN